MKLSIQKNETLASVKQTFNAAFPFLKLGFFSCSHVPGTGSRLGNMITGNRKLGEIYATMKEGSINISGDKTVVWLEQSFQYRFGIYVQVMRKQGDLWVETTATDAMTLDQQNQKGKQSSAVINADPVEDRDLTDGQF